MEIGGVIERAERVAAVRADAAADKHTVESGLVAVRELRAWCDAREVRATRAQRHLADMEAQRADLDVAIKELREQLDWGARELKKHADDKAA